MDIEESSASCNMEPKMTPTAPTTINELGCEGELCDVVIKAGGAEFRAHRYVLCGCSPYFRALFTSSWNTHVMKAYDIPGVSPDIMTLVLEYAYSRTVSISSENVESLFIAADYLNILGLVRLCSQFLLSQLCPENCIGILKFSEYYYWPELHQEASVYVLRNFERIVKTSDEMRHMSAEELRVLIEREEVSAAREDGEEEEEEGEEELF